MDPQPSSKPAIIKTIYLYLVSFVALMMVVFSTADLINTVLRTFIFTKADRVYFYEPYTTPADCLSLKTAEVKGTASTSTPTSTVKYCADMAKLKEEKNNQNEEQQAAQKQRDVVRDISMILVGVPLFIYHWRLVRRKDS